MDAKKVRVGLWVTGAISCLILLLYLPVLIWSPPWALNGYFLEGVWLIDGKVTSQDDHAITITPFYSFHDGNLNAHYFDWDNAPDIHRVYDLNVKYEQVDKGIWTYRDANGWAQNIHISNSQITKSINIDKEIKVPLIKVSNPFTLWHIKWLEWTAE